MESAGVQEYVKRNKMKMFGNMMESVCIRMSNE